MAHAPDPGLLRTNLAGVALRNPLILASGTAGYGLELADVLDLARVGAVVTKSITARPRQGNKTWRILETRHGGMLNAIGLANVGMEVFERDVAPRLASAPTTIIGSVAGFTIEDYLAVAAMFEGIDSIPAIELNLSCPNVSGGMEFGFEPGPAGEVVAAVRRHVSRLKVWVKLSPITADLVGVARACIDAGADALTLGNTFPAMAIDVESRRPRLSRGTGGLSGPAIHPIAVRHVHEVYRALARDARVPLIGLGGVMRWADAAEFILAGASAVGMGTALFADPRAPLAVVRGLERWVRRQRAASLADLVGAVELTAPSTPAPAHAPAPAPGAARP